MDATFANKPVMAPSWTDQITRWPSQPLRSLPLKSIWNLTSAVPQAIGMAQSARLALAAKINTPARPFTVPRMSASVQRSRVGQRYHNGYHRSISDRGPETIMFRTETALCCRNLFRGERQARLGRIPKPQRAYASSSMMPSSRFLGIAETLFCNQVDCFRICHHPGVIAKMHKRGHEGIWAR